MAQKTYAEEVKAKVEAGEYRLLNLEETLDHNIFGYTARVFRQNVQNPSECLVAGKTIGEGPYTWESAMVGNYKADPTIELAIIKPSNLYSEGRAEKDLIRVRRKGTSKEAKVGVQEGEIAGFYEPCKTTFWCLWDAGLRKVANELYRQIKDEETKDWEKTKESMKGKKDYDGFGTLLHW